MSKISLNDTDLGLQLYHSDALGQYHYIDDSEYDYIYAAHVEQSNDVVKQSYDDYVNIFQTKDLKVDNDNNAYEAFIFLKIVILQRILYDRKLSA